MLPYLLLGATHSPQHSKLILAIWCTGEGNEYLSFIMQDWVVVDVDVV
jgi:hypothetical protein